MTSASSVLLLLLFSLNLLGAEGRPNILIIYADDLGYGDVRCYNPDRGKIPTPRMDRLAAEGMRFTDAHSSSGVCSPSRYTLLTGRYHWRSRLQSGIVRLWEKPLIPHDRLTLASLAKKHGYRTACIGKWHLGWSWHIPPEKRALLPGHKSRDFTATTEQVVFWRELFSQPIPGGPTALGFDKYFGTDVPNWPPYCFIEDERTVGIPDELLPSRMLGSNLAGHPGPSLAGWKLEGILPAITGRAVAFVADAAKNPDPFLLFFSLTAPHTPLAVNEEWRGKSGLGSYADLVMETDAMVGHLLDALQASGVAENTLVLLTSDNGCAPYIGMAELEGKGHFPSGPYCGAKSDAWEGGHRVPFIVRWPGRVKPGAVNHQLVHQADLMRTIADILGANLPENAGEDSFSILPSLKGDGQAVRPHAVSTSVSGVPALRIGHLKYIAAPGSGGWSKGGDPKQPVQLYDLSADPGETRNLAATMPAKVVEARRLLETLIVRGRSTPGKAQGNDVQVKRHPASVLR